MGEMGSFIHCGLPGSRCGLPAWPLTCCVNLDKFLSLNLLPLRLYGDLAGSFPGASLTRFSLSR